MTHIKEESYRCCQCHVQHTADKLQTLVEILGEEGNRYHSTLQEAVYYLRQYEQVVTDEGCL